MDTHTAAALTPLACPRNIFILGFAIYMGLSIPNYFGNFGPTVTTTTGTPTGPLITDPAGNPLSCRNPNLFPVHTGNSNFNGAVCSHMLSALLHCCATGRMQRQHSSVPASTSARACHCAFKEWSSDAAASRACSDPDLHSKACTCLRSGCGAVDKAACRSRLCSLMMHCHKLSPQAWGRMQHGTAQLGPAKVLHQPSQGPLSWCTCC